MKIYYSTKFSREYKRLSLHLQELAEEKEIIFCNNPFDPRLRTHALEGRFKGFWAFWIDYKNRIIFDFKEKGVVMFHSVGDHSIYR